MRSRPSQVIHLPSTPALCGRLQIPGVSARLLKLPRAESCAGFQILLLETSNFNLETNPMPIPRLALLLLPLFVVACASTDGIEVTNGGPTSRLIFAQGIMLSAVPGAEPVKPVRINGRKPGALRWDHNQFDAPAGSLTVEVQAVPSGVSGLTAVSGMRFEAKPGETYRFAHRPESNDMTTFIVVDSQGQVIGVAKAKRWPSPTQSPMYQSNLPPAF